MKPCTIVTFVALAFTASTRSQTVWRVGGANASQDLQAVINLASPGDTILVEPPRNPLAPYGNFVLNKGLTIRGNVSIEARADIRLGWPYVTTIDIPPGQTARLQGLRWTYGYSPFGSIGSSIAISRGRVTLEDVVLFCGSATALAVGNAQLVLIRTSISRPGFLRANSALVATASHLTVRDCAISGGGSGCDHPIACGNSFPAVAAVVLSGCDFHAERTRITGGIQDARLVADGGPAVITTGSSLWLGDCTLTGGSSASRTGGTALVHGGPTPAMLRATTLTGGAPGGIPSTGPVTANAPLLRVAMAGPFVRGFTTVFQVSGEPFHPVLLLIARSQLPVSYPLLADAPLWIVGGIPVLSGTMDGAGRLDIPVFVPNVADLENGIAWLQAIAGTQLPISASTLTSGTIF